MTVPAGEGYRKGLVGRLAFAVLFSTGEDKPGGRQCSGGVDPNSLRYSFLDGRNFELIPSAAWYQLNIDAIAVVWNVGSPPEDETKHELGKGLVDTQNPDVLPDGVQVPGPTGD